MDDSFCRLKPPYEQVTALWKITSACNLACVHCFISREYSAPDTWDATIAEARQLGITRIVITGGEPLLHPQLPDLVAKLRGFATVILTNGVLLTRRRAEQLQTAGVVAFSISLHSHRAAVQDRIAGRAFTLARVLTACGECRELAIPFSISTVVLPDNADHLGDMIDMAFTQGARSMAINSCLPYPGISPDLRTWIARWDPEPVREIIRAKRAVYGAGRIKTSGLFPVGEHCPAGTAFHGISNAGQWARCLPEAETGGSGLFHPFAVYRTQPPPARMFCPLLVESVADQE